MNRETALLDNPLECIKHQLADISLGIDQLAHDLSTILALVHQREDVGSRLSHVEQLLHLAIMGDEDEDALTS